MRIKPDRFDPTKIVSSKSNPYGIPRELRRWVKKKYNWQKYKEFEKWYSTNIRASQKNAADAYKEFTRSLELAGGDKGKGKSKGKYSPNYSHVQSHTLGGSGYTFLEYWVYNQARSAAEKSGKPFINPQILEEAGLPKNWAELFYAWDNQTKGNYSSLGSLETVNPDDLIALHRGDQVNTVFSRREQLNNLYEAAISDPTTISTNAEVYNQLFAESRGLNPDDHIERNWLSRHTGWKYNDEKGEWLKIPEDEIEKDYEQRERERFAHPGEVNYGPLGELQPEIEITGASEGDPEAIDAYQRGEIGHPSEMRHKWLQNPFANMPKAQFDEIDRKENKWINRARDLSIRGLIETLPTKALPPPVKNTLGIITDQTLGKEIRNQDRLINQSYQERVNPQRAVEIIAEEFDPNTSYFKGNR